MIWLHAEWYKIYIVKRPKQERKYFLNIANDSHSLQQTPGYKVKYKQGSKFSSEREALLKKRKELLGKLKRSKIDVDHLEKDITRLKKDLDQAGKYGSTRQVCLSQVPQLSLTQVTLNPIIEQQYGTQRYLVYCSRLSVYQIFSEMDHWS